MTLDLLNICETSQHICHKQVYYIIIEDNLPALRSLYLITYSYTWNLKTVLICICICDALAVEVKVELTLLENEKEADLMSPNGKASPFSECRPNGSLGHSSDDDSSFPRPSHKHRDYIEAAVCHVKDLENGQ